MCQPPEIYCVIQHVLHCVKRESHEPSYGSLYNVNCTVQHSPVDRTKVCISFSIFLNQLCILYRL